ncbi:hypothetical protein Actkin_04526 [Actinokineospora sp. UTMC 2448]|nr:hypothetical protein Actkin_04526 [Actinokineospora sp. UTMC 2448]
MRLLRLSGRGKCAYITDDRPSAALLGESKKLTCLPRGLQHLNNHHRRPSITRTAQDIPTGDDAFTELSHQVLRDNPPNRRIIEGHDDVLHRDHPQRPDHVKRSTNPDNRMALGPNAHHPAAQTRAHPSRDPSARQADRGVVGRHAIGPAWPVIAVVGQHPQHAVVVSIRRARAHLAQQSPHHPPLPQRVDVAENRPAHTRTGLHPRPENAVPIPIAHGLIPIPDPRAAGHRHNHGGQDAFAAPRRDIGDRWLPRHNPSTLFRCLFDAAPDLRSRGGRFLYRGEYGARQEECGRLQESAKESTWTTSARCSGRPVWRRE